MTKYTLLVLAIAALTGCKSDAGANPSENVSNVEADGVHAESDEIQVQNEKIEVESDKVQTQNEETAAPGRETDSAPDLSEMEIYEGFLNGEIRLEKEKEQVCISDLFWDNDIEYCFWDIDGDGSEELQIRDSSAYYAVKVKDQRPWIIFEGWWVYEPVVTDEGCGILYYNHGYGREYIEFIRLNPDGSEESDGEYRWEDNNLNGEIDEEDSVSINFKDMDRKQYAAYREEQIARQAGNELEWKSRRLKDFASWQDAYIDFISKLDVTVMVGTNDEYDEYSLIYVDGDDVPELFISIWVDEIVVSFYDGKVRAMDRDRGGISYLEYDGLLYSRNGHMGLNPCNIYRLDQGEFSEIGTGWEQEHIVDEENVYWECFWEGKAVTVEEYDASINELIDTSKCIKPPFVCSKDEMLEKLEKPFIF